MSSVKVNWSIYVLAILLFMHKDWIDFITDWQSKRGTGNWVQNKISKLSTGIWAMAKRQVRCLDQIHLLGTSSELPFKRPFYKATITWSRPWNDSLAWIHYTCLEIIKATSNKSLINIAICPTWEPEQFSTQIEAREQTLWAKITGASRRLVIKSHLMRKKSHALLDKTLVGKVLQIRL